MYRKTAVSTGLVLLALGALPLCACDSLARKLLEPGNADESRSSTTVDSSSPRNVRANDSTRESRKRASMDSRPYDPSAPCAASEVRCGGMCTDPLTSNGACGAKGDCLGPNAGSVCYPGTTCRGGRCERR